MKVHASLGHWKVSFLSILKFKDTVLADHIYMIKLLVVRRTEHKPIWNWISCSW
jgi:hypothetical protein